MDFTVPEELQALRDAFGSFLQREVRPVEERWKQQLDHGEWTDAMREDAQELRRRSAREGFYACYVPAEHGGQGVSSLGTALLVEDAFAAGMAFGQWLIGPPHPSSPSPVIFGAQPHVLARYLPGLLSGERTMCFALTEPEAGSDAQSIRTKATRTDGGWILEGTKHFITSADEAEVCLAFAVNDAAKRANGGITAFLVPRDGYRVVRKQLTVADTHPYELVFEGTFVPDDHVVGEVGDGFRAAMGFLNSGRAYIGAACLGMAEHALAVAVDHAKSRTAFGVPLARHQGVSFQLADTKVEIEAARWLTYHLAWQVDRGEASPLHSSIVKLHNTEAAFRALDRAMQVLGGQGLMRELRLERDWRLARVLRVLEGASEVQRVVIARALGL